MSTQGVTAALQSNGLAAFKLRELKSTNLYKLGFAESKVGGF